jgi:hypothetical protein
MNNLFISLCLMVCVGHLHKQDAESFYFSICTQNGTTCYFIKWNHSGQGADWKLLFYTIWSNLDQGIVQHPHFEYSLWEPGGAPEGRTYKSVSSAQLTGTPGDFNPETCPHDSSNSSSFPRTGYLWGSCSDSLSFCIRLSVFLILGQWFVLVPHFCWDLGI